MAEDPAETTAAETQTGTTTKTEQAGAFMPITSQEDFDKRIQERIARVKTAPPADYEELKKAAERLAELEAASKTELEKANERAAKFEREAADARIHAQELTLRGAIVAEAAKRQLVDPDAAVAMLDRSTLEFDTDGHPTNIAEAMDSLLKAKPYLAGGGARGLADQGARGSSDVAGDMNHLLRRAAGHTT